MTKFNSRLAMATVFCFAILSACDSKNNQSKSTAVLDTISLSSRSFALAYQDGNKIVATSIDTMKQISFGGATEPAISPDGNKLAYTVADSVGNKSIWIADLENKSQLQLQANAKNFQHAVWSPDGNRIVFQITNDQNAFKIGLVKTDNTGFLTLDPKSKLNLYSPTWKTNHEILAHDLSNLYVFDLNGKLLITTPLSSLIDKIYQVTANSSFFYTEDGKKMVFNASTGSAQNVFILDLDTKKVTRISPEGMNVPYIFLTADNRIFFSGADQSSAVNRIYFSDLDGHIKTIVDQGTNPTGALK